MVIGLDKFAEHFAEFRDRYVLIGGAAVWLVLDDAGLEPRATKDLDIVLCVEALDEEFGRAVWEFVRAGRYEIQGKSSGKKTFYRFSKPGEEGYPVMLELFSRIPANVALKDNGHLTPIPIGKDVSSLSAILLEEDYYELLHAHKKEIEGVSIVSEACLIPLKARAWLDLRQRKADGEKIDSKDIKKHRTDIIRLYQLLNPDDSIHLPESVRQDMTGFLDQLVVEEIADVLKQIGIKDSSADDVIAAIRGIYNI